MDIQKIEEGFRMIISGLGLDLAEPDLKETPERAAAAWRDELCAGLTNPPLELELWPLENARRLTLVALGDIPVKSICAHHLLPFVGKATVAYLPDNFICGLSKLSQVVDHFARRPQLQEKLTGDIAEFLHANLKSRGVGVTIKATHYCMELRGVNHSGLMSTSSFLGDFEKDSSLRAEFLALTNS